jgi:hypothetical protein
MDEKSREELEKQFMKLEAELEPLSGQFTGVTDARAILGIALLGIATVKLDRTSSRLATVNICLTVALVVVGVIQIILMLWHK